MELPELSLAPTQFVKSNSSSPKSESNSSRKRKLLHDHHMVNSEPAAIQTSVDLQVKDPLPLDWEQCLDLESGKMYYLNRKTLRKSWNWPKDQKLDLELNISTLSYNCSADQQYCRQGNDHHNTFEDSKNNSNNKLHCSSGSNMVALACLNCHLLVILSKSSPACPNCKYVHSLPNLQNSPTKISSAVKSVNTLSLLN